MVRSTRAQAAANRDRIIAEAAARFRAQGFAGVGVDEIMRAAGLTHGGFYRHFASKDELKALACRRAVADMLVEWRARAAARPDQPLAAIAEPYLSAGHRDRPGEGCLMAALGAEATRETVQVRRAVTESLEEVLAFLAGLEPAEPAPVRRRRAVRLFSSLVGAMVAARAVDDPALSDEILATVRDGLLAERR